jgi:O-antigen ligase
VPPEETIDESSRGQLRPAPSASPSALLERLPALAPGRTRLDAGVTDVYEIGGRAQTGCQGSGDSARRQALSRGLVLCLGAILLVRVLTDDLSMRGSRYSGALNLSGAIAVVFILAAICVLLAGGRGARPAALAALWLCVWIAVAVGTRGASTETLRDGVREGSVLALALLVYNMRGMTVASATRLLQWVGAVSALIALYQLATHTGMDVGDLVRPNGTFAHPNSAVMFFAITTVASLWRYLDHGRHWSDAVFTALFAGAAVATTSIDGVVSLVVMMVAFGLLHPGGVGAKLVPCALAAVVALVFLLTPLGTQHIAKETSTNIAAAERGEANSSLAWRVKKWKSLLPTWESSPVFGQGLGTTTTVRSIPGHRLAAALPHNEYLRYLVETGVVGLAALLAGVGYLLRGLLRRRSFFAAPATDAFNAPGLAIAIVLGCLMNALADNTFLDSPTCYAAALLVIAVLGMRHVSSEAQLAAAHPSVA